MSSNSCTAPNTSSSCNCISSSSIKYAKKLYKKDNDTACERIYNSSDIAESFNTYMITTTKGCEDKCDSYFSTFINNPTWGWVILVVVLILFFRRKAAEFIDIYKDKIKESVSGELSAGPVKAVYQGKEDDVSPFKEEANNPLQNQDNLNMESGKKDDDIYFPLYNDILGNSIANKILSTLYHYQKEIGKDNNNKTRWSFYEPNNIGFAYYARQLLLAGLIIPNGKQFMLSNVGIRFCKRYEARLDETNIYSSFQN